MENINKLAPGDRKGVPGFEEIVSGAIQVAPLTLLMVKDPRLQEITNGLLPYSTGIEIECENSKEYALKNFLTIPGIMDVNNSPHEQRYRIPSGLNGILCLYCLSIQLKHNSLLNNMSGLHFHVDMNGFRGVIITQDFIDTNSNWILEELDTWNYKGKYNARRVMLGKGGWLCFRKDTIEVRIGEMTFEYKELLNRIIHVNSIAHRLRHKLGISRIIQNEVPLDPNRFLDYIRFTGENVHRLGKLAHLDAEIELLSNETLEPVIDESVVQNVINSRIIRLC